MSTPADDENSIRRIDLSFIGLDLIILNGQKYIEQASNSGDLYKIGDVCEKFEDLPWLLRRYLPTTRLWSEEYKCHFMPNRKPLNEEYNAARKFLEENYKPNTVNMQPYAAEVAKALLQESPNASDAEKGETHKVILECFARVLTAPMLAPGKEIPDEIIEKVADVNESIASSFLPLRSRKATKAVGCIMKYVHENITTPQGLPDGCTADVAHTIFNSGQESIILLSRAILADPTRPIEETFGVVGPTKNVMRMCKIDTTLRGLLPKDKPMRKGKTIVLMNIRNVAQKRMDTLFCFGTNTKDRNGLERRCCLENAVLEYFDAIRKEVLSQSGKKIV